LFKIVSNHQVTIYVGGSNFTYLSKKQYNNAKMLYSMSDVSQIKF